MLDDASFENVIVLIGEELALARTYQGISTKELANNLLLSTAQIEGIESGIIRSFYNRKLYLQSADKYAVFIGITPLPSERIQAISDAKVMEAEAVVLESLPTSSAALAAATSFSIRNIVFLLLMPVGVALYFINQHYATSHFVFVADPAQETNGPAPNSAQSTPNLSVPELQAQVLPKSAINVRLQFHGACWIQTVTTNGQKIERTYQAGDSVNIYPQSLQALIIGNRKSISLVSQNGSEINLSAFTNSDTNVVRIIGENIRNLGRTN